MLHAIDTNRAGAAPAGQPCDGCRNRGPACSNCVFQAVIRSDGEAVLEFDADERAAIAALAGQGLVPPLRLAPLHAA